jgi:hypothetical protein
MGFSFHATGCVKRAKECRDESHTINGSAPAAKTKENLAEMNRTPSPLIVRTSVGRIRPLADLN